jgi:hypothetical protein
MIDDNCGGCSDDSCSSIRDNEEPTVVVNALKKVIMHYHDSRDRCHDNWNGQHDGEVVLVLMIVMSSYYTGTVVIIAIIIMIL